jgi:hypothetical protein
MSAPLDDSDFIDRDFLASQSAASRGPALPSAGVSSAAAGSTSRPPNREGLEARLTERHQQLAELKRAPGSDRAGTRGLEEARRRQAEFETGRPEIMQHLTRGIELVEQAEFRARRGRPKSWRRAWRDCAKPSARSGDSR